MPKPVVTNARPRQARALVTRRKLIDAARAAFAEHGVEGSNLREHILIPSGVSTGSFYHQFTDKTDLLIEVISAGIDERHELILGGATRGHATDVDSAVAAAFEAFFQSLDDERHAWRVQLSEQHHADARVRAVVLDGRERWVEAIATRLGRFRSGGLGSSDAVPGEPDPVRQASLTLVSFATGTANIYLSLADEQRAQQRAKLLESSIRFAVAGTASFFD